VKLKSEVTKNKLLEIGGACAPVPTVGDANGHYTGQPQLKKLEDFVGAKFSCPHALTHGNQHIQIREKMLEFSSSVLSTLSPYLIIRKIQLLKVYRTSAIYS